jgi:beta-phosphoglucomutase-like phosphatase (HAD superfamily)
MVRGHVLVPFRRSFIRGLGMPREDVRIHGKGIIEVIARVRLRHELNLRDGMMSQPWWKPLFTKELLRVISGAGVKIGLVTSTNSRQLDMKLYPLRKSGMDLLLGAVVTADDVEKRKPAPEPLLECAARLGVPPGECLYVGDRHVDMRAGKAAGTGSSNHKSASLFLICWFIKTNTGIFSN